MYSDLCRPYLRFSAICDPDMALCDPVGVVS